MDEVTAVNAFALDVHRAVDVAGNVAISALSIQICMAMLHAGAGGATRAQIGSASWLDDEMRGALGVFVRALAVPRTSGASELRVASRLYVRRDLPLRRDYARGIAEAFGAEPVTIDFADAGAAAQINEWISLVTRGKIPDLIDALDPSTPLLLANALYVAARWEQSFSLAAPAPFFVDGERVPVPTMQSAQHCARGETDDFEIVGLRLQGGELQLTLFVPRDPRGVLAVEGAIDASLLGRAARLETTHTTVHLPKFRIEAPTISLIPALRALGVRDALDPEHARFDGIAELASGSPPLFVGEALHKTYCDVDERGIEAAASTAFAAMGGAAPRAPKKVVRVDRPFFFAIQHLPSGACLFTGRVTDPRR